LEAGLFESVFQKQVVVGKVFFFLPVYTGAGKEELKIVRRKVQLWGGGALREKEEGRKVKGE